jgi:hypothetical protein
VVGAPLILFFLSSLHTKKCLLIIASKLLLWQSEWFSLNLEILELKPWWSGCISLTKNFIYKRTWLLLSFCINGTGWCYNVLSELSSG